MKKILAGCLVALSLALSGCAAPADLVATVVAVLPTVTTAAEEAVSAEALAAGVAVYRQQYCGICHTLDAAETRGIFGPPHNQAATSAAAHLADPGYVGTATTVAEYLRESIVKPEVYIVDGYAATAHRMPPYAHLPSEDIDALVYLLIHQQ